MQLTRAGKDLAEIRAFIDTKYSQSGPATDTEPVIAPLGPLQPQTPEIHQAATPHEGDGGSCGQNVQATTCQ